MRGYRPSYVKTLVTAAALGLAVIVILLLAEHARFGLLKPLVEAVGGAVLVVIACVAAGGTLALYRDDAQAKGRMDLFERANAIRSEAGLTTAQPGSGIVLRRIGRWILGSRRLLVGDMVEIRSLDEIRRTLDGSRCLDRLPFMPEMAKFCGQRARVFRCVDKIHDYNRSKALRRLRDVVLLVGLRCDGGAHGGCQASCYLLWKEAWLKPAPEGCSEHERTGHGTPTLWSECPPSTGPYTCQFTQLAAASTPMSRWDIWQDVRPLVSGNVTVGAFCVAVLTRLFNAVQRARDGVSYPSMTPETGGAVGSVECRFAPGDTVRVRSMEDIVATLDEGGRHLGLWFDRDMVKHCKRRYNVLKRVDRIIDDVTGRMLEMKTPCLVLAGVEASGEFLRFCAQHEYPFWREAWLSSEPE